MEKMLKRLLSSALSLISTCLIMATPVAAMIYASEPAAAIEESFSIKETTSSAATAKSQVKTERTDILPEPGLIDKTKEFSALTGKE